MRRLFFIVNPNSNAGRAEKRWQKDILPQVLKIFPNMSWAFSQESAQASLLAQNAAKNHFDTIVAVGGDGTINEILNGLFTKTDLYKPTLAFLPTGTGCDFIKSLNIPNHIPSALQIIKENITIYSDIGLIQYSNTENSENMQNRYFINIASCGVSGETVNRINNSHKVFGSSFSFLYAALKTVLHNKHYEVRIAYDNEAPVESDLSVLFICNGKYCGGGMLIAKNASLQDGFFHVVQINAMGLLKNLFSMSRLYSGNYSGLNKYISERTAKKISISAIKKTRVLVECDGEQPGLLPTTFTIVPNALSICVGASYFL